MQAGADVNPVCAEGTTALILASKQGSPGCVQTLVTAGASVNAYDHELLSEAGADVNALSRKGQTPLMCALQKKAYGCVSALIQCGADVNLASLVSKRPPLAMAVLRGTPYVQLLLKNKVHVNNTCSIYVNTLDWYVSKFAKINWNVVKLLLVAGETPKIALVERVATSHYAMKELKEIKDSLKSLCRQAVRNLLRSQSPVNLFCSVPDLEPELPASLLPYLLYDMSLEEQYSDISDDDDDNYDEEDSDDESWSTSDDGDDMV